MTVQSGFESRVQAATKSVEANAGPEAEAAAAVAAQEQVL